MFLLNPQRVLPDTLTDKQEDKAIRGNFQVKKISILKGKPAVGIHGSSAEFIDYVLCEHELMKSLKKRNAAIADAFSRIF
jgi:hypothetical protein